MKLLERREIKRGDIVYQPAYLTKQGNLFVPQLWLASSTDERDRVDGLIVNSPALPAELVRAVYEHNAVVAGPEHSRTWHRLEVECRAWIDADGWRDSHDYDTDCTSCVRMAELVNDVERERDELRATLAFPGRDGVVGVKIEEVLEVLRRSPDPMDLASMLDVAVQEQKRRGPRRPRRSRRGGGVDSGHCTCDLVGGDPSFGGPAWCPKCEAPVRRSVVRGDAEEE